MPCIWLPSGCLTELAHTAASPELLSITGHFLEAILRYWASILTPVIHDTLEFDTLEKWMQDESIRW